MITLFIVFILISIILKINKKDWKDYIILNSILSGIIVGIISLIIEGFFINRYDEPKIITYTNIVVDDNKINYSDNERYLEDINEIVKSDTTYYKQCVYEDNTNNFNNIIWVTILPLGDFISNDTLFLSEKDWNKIKNQKGLKALSFYLIK